MKLSKEELKNKINEVVTDEDTKITLLEDVEDSFEVEGETISKEDYEKVVAERDEIKKKYKERFLSGGKEEKTETEEVKEEKEIDVKEI